jgi:hypothetical protein
MTEAEAARIAIEAREAERFLILSHPTVHDYVQRKASNIDRWLMECGGGATEPMALSAEADIQPLASASPS